MKKRREPATGIGNRRIRESLRKADGLKPVWLGVPLFSRVNDS